MPEPAAIEFETLFRQLLPGTPRWSPDGEWLAFAVSFTDEAANAAGSAVWRMSRDGTVRVRITAGRKPDGAPATETLPCWSPDGQHLAFCSNRSGTGAVWRIPAFGGEAARLTGDGSGCGPVMTDPFFAGLEWSPDGTRIVFAAPLPEEDDPEDGDARVQGLDRGETYGHVRTPIHLWTVGTEGGAARRITDGEYDHGDPRWSPDGRSICFVSNRTPDQGPVSSSINKNYDLWLVPADGGPERQLTENPGPDFSPRWSPEGSRIAYLSGSRCGPHRDHYHVCILDLASRAVEDLTPDWDALPDALSAQPWSADGRAVHCSAWMGAESHLFRLSVTERQIEQLSDGPLVCGTPAVAPHGGIAVVVQAADVLAEVQVRTAVGAIAGATDFNAWLSEYRVQPHEVVSWESEEWRIEGVLVKPPGWDPGRPGPGLLFVHGGPHHRVTCALNLEWQALAAAGYAVLAPNFRGSAGYGAAFLDADRGDWGGGDFRDVLRGADFLVEHGIADPDRLGVLGGSYGGYMTCWTVANTDRFRAAVARAPITHLTSYYGTTDLQTLTAWDLGGTPWERPELYRERSPWTHAARVHTPLLLLHGDADRRVPFSQSEEFYTALKALRATVSLIRYPAEGHLIAQPRHVKHYWTRTREWLDRYLRDAVPGAPVTGD